MTATLDRTPKSPARRLTAWLPLALLGWAVSGCSGDGGGPSLTQEVYPVKGQVLLANGKPLTSGKVFFLPKSADAGLAASGTIGSDGGFTLKTGDREGAAAGQYKVRIEPEGMTPAKTKADLRKLPFPSRYTDQDADTGLEATVKAEPNTLEPFKLVEPAAGETSKTRD